ncbi:hypothetical protein [Citreimonas sp.]|uniref:hypothetical protein n=1 Tax=Citreimonas sp. TaxID=3036715 RepID=UPI0035C7D1D0
MPEPTEPLKAFALDCSLRRYVSDSPSSTDRMIDDLIAALSVHGVRGETERVVDHDVKPGVPSDMGQGSPGRPDFRKGQHAGARMIRTRAA